MKIIRTQKDLQLWRENLPKNISLGFVPTMGALHRGHLSLIKRAQEENDKVIVSIFVNPTQFTQKEDLEKYPRKEEQDIDLIKKYSPIDALYLPSVDEVYPQDKLETTDENEIDLQGLDRILEGKSRPGHFAGVAQVVSYFFDLIQPTCAYFGEKDFQQVAVIRRLIEYKNYPIQLRVCPIIRETNGLAMSSRNERLSSNARQEAGWIYELLIRVKEMIESGISIPEIHSEVLSVCKNHPTFTLDYFIIVDDKTLEEVHDINIENSYQICIAVWVENVRLIDTLHIPKK